MNRYFRIAVRLSLSLVVLLILPSVSRASEVTFKYVLSGAAVLSGTMDGALQSDSNTFIVTSMGPVSLNAVLGPALPNLYSMDFFFGFNPSAIPTVTLDGSFMDLLACTDAVCSTDGFAFGAGDLFVANIPIFRGGIFQGAAFYGNSIEGYDPSHWSASVGSVPEPSGLMLLGTGALGFFGPIRRKLLG